MKSEKQLKMMLGSTRAELQQRHDDAYRPVDDAYRPVDDIYKICLNERLELLKWILEA